MLDRRPMDPREPTAALRRAQVNPAAPATPGRGRRFTGFTGLVAGPAAFVGGALTGGGPAVLLIGVVAILAVTMVIAMILVIGFVRAMASLAAEGRRRARSVDDVDTVVAGIADAYRQVLTQLGGLVHGTAAPWRHGPVADRRDPPGAR